MSCLSEQTIAQYVEAGLPDEAAAQVEEHIDECADCRMAIAETARGRSPLSDSPQPFAITLPAEPRSIPPTPVLMPGAQLGRYIVRRFVGGGGMGLVYAAYDPQLDREVALKLLRPELTRGDSVDSRGLSERLLREAQLMARLTHPNVVAVYDVGVLDGQVFVAMELVVGETLRQKLRTQRQRPWREVLGLFLAAGRGLSAAHRVHMVHRDFKPDNVLVAQDGRVQVTDFGLARVVRGDDRPALQAAASGTYSVADGQLTRTGALLGTPAYMAPEQLRGDGADERSDQFAFCVALYEGLHGERPFVGDTADALAAAIEKGATPRSTSVPAWLRRVVLRGLRADASERFASMDALIEALTNNPVERFWRRVGVAALSILLLVAAVAALRPRPPARTCKGAAERLAGVWDAARKQAVQRAFTATKMPYAADAFSGLSRALDDYAQAWTAMHTEACEATWLRGEQSAELLDRRMQCLEKQRQLLQARVAVYETADVEGVRRAVSAAPSAAELRVCADAKEVLQWIQRPTRPESQAQLTTLEQKLARLRARHQAGQYQPSLEEAQRTATESATLAYPPVEAEAQLLLGDFQEAVGDFTAAESSYYRALWAGESGRQDRIAVEAWTRLVYVVGYRQDRAAESQRMVQHAEASLRRLGGDDIETARLESAAGVIAFKTGRYDEALSRYGKSRALFEKALGPESIEVAEVLQRTSFALEPSAQFEAAIALERQGLAILKKRLGPEHPEVAAGRLRLGEHLMLNEFYAQALVEVQGALGIYERSYPADDIHVAAALHGVASVLIEMQRGREALPLAERALTIRESRFGPTHSDVAEALTVHSMALLQTGQIEMALAENRRAQALFAQTLGTSHVKYSFTLLDLGLIYAAKQEPRRAIAAYRESMAVLQRSQVTDVWAFARPQLGIARAELAQNNQAAAMAQLEATLATLDRFDPTSMFLPDACFELAQLLAKQGRDEPRVRALTERAITLYAKVEVVRKERLLEAQRFLAKLPPKQ